MTLLRILASHMANEDGLSKSAFPFSVKPCSCLIVGMQAHVRADIYGPDHTSRPADTVNPFAVVLRAKEPSCAPSCWNQTARWPLGSENSRWDVRCCSSASLLNSFRIDYTSSTSIRYMVDMTPTVIMCRHPHGSWVKYARCSIHLHLSLSLSVCLSLFIYIYTYICIIHHIIEAFDVYVPGALASPGNSLGQAGEAAGFGGERGGGRWVAEGLGLSLQRGETVMLCR